MTDGKRVKTTSDNFLAVFFNVTVFARLHVASGLFQVASLSDRKTENLIKIFDGREKNRKLLLTDNRPTTIDAVR